MLTVLWQTEKLSGTVLNRPKKTYQIEQLCRDDPDNDTTIRELIDRRDRAAKGDHAIIRERLKAILGNTKNKTDSDAVDSVDYHQRRSEEKLRKILGSLDSESS